MNTAKELDNETSYTYFGARYYDTDLSIWLSVDPMSDKYPSLSPYCYTADNPVVLVDPNGTYVDWYRNKTTGEIKWFDREGVQGEIEVIYGEEYENLGSELLKFNGKKLTYYWQTKTKEGKLQLNEKSWNAVSGRPLKDKNNLIFDYSKKSQNSKNGPIPEGLWGLKKSGIQYWEDQSLLDKLLNKLGRGEFPGGLNSWGENRWWLDPVDVNAKNRDLNSFTIHGGINWGSRGCIDLTHNLNDFTKTLLKYGKNNNIFLQVDYSRNKNLRIIQYQWGW